MVYNNHFDKHALYPLYKFKYYKNDIKRAQIFSVMESIFSFESSIGNGDKLVLSSCQTIETLYQKYHDDLYMTSKIHHYISQQLPSLLENIKVSREKSIQRNEEHTHEQERFIRSYLGQQKFYYHSTNEIYYHYDGVHYQQIKEEDILHDIVSSISKDRNPMLMNWKHKTKVSILKRIKECSITKCIPESVTIQDVLQQLRPYVCGSKSEAKYFLTIIGDNILKKNLSLIHFINPDNKEFLKYINHVCLEYFNTQCTQTFKYKYHEKHYEQNEDCRLVSTPDVLLKEDWFRTLSVLDLLCVALHYSNKYSSSDEYVLEKSADADLQRHVFQLINIKPIDRIQQFIQDYLYDHERTGAPVVSSSPQEEYFLQQHLQTIETSENKSLSWKEIQYLWKDFLMINKLPLHLYSSFYKKIFVEECFPDKYDETNDSFSNLGSSQIPLIQKFLRFWSETTIEDNNVYAELESEEISYLFRKWLNQNGLKKKNKYNLKESKILDILAYFHPELEITNNKYVFSVRNFLWDKELDIENALTTLRETKDDQIAYPSISLYDAYLYYCKFYNGQKDSKPLLASKSYFENYVVYHYGSDLDDNNTFLEKWFVGN